MGDRWLGGGVVLVSASHADVVPDPDPPFRPAFDGDIDEELSPEMTGTPLTKSMMMMSARECAR